MTQSNEKSIAIIGAGPAGLTAGYFLAKEGFKVEIFEKDPEYVGGIARTVKQDGFRFDIGGHRFFTKSPEVWEFWNEVFPNKFLLRSRLSRIYYRHKFFNYPLKLEEVFFKFSLLEKAQIFFSYLKARLNPPKDISNFEDWTVSQFGERLYKIFFKDYTEKVWGMKCNEISSDWAAQRISGMNLLSVALNTIKGLIFSSEKKIKSLINEFHYPTHGPGELWEEVRKRYEELGGVIHMGKSVEGYHFENNQWSIKNGNGGLGQFDILISSSPIVEFAKGLTPEPPKLLKERINHLKYRDFLTVALMFEGENPFKDNWIYIHNNDVKVARVQNYKNWSEGMVPTEKDNCLGLEYFCQEGDELWEMEDEELISLAQKEMGQLGFHLKGNIKGKVIRVEKAYPKYDSEYKNTILEFKNFINNNYPTFYPIGRNGLHRYNNQDHSIMTAILVVKNILGLGPFDQFKVNQDAIYLEE